jgi:type II secretory pathway pseudopilin PulG
MPGRSSHAHGVTVLALLVVLVILSLTAATSVRWYFSRGEVTLENAAVLLARDLRAAQHRSIFLGRAGHLHFLPDGSGYVLLDEHGELAQNPQTGEPFTRVYPDDGVFVGVEVRSVRAGADRTLAIDTHGQFTEDLEAELAFQGDVRAVRVDRATGGIEIVGSTSAWEDPEP